MHNWSILELVHIKEVCPDVVSDVEKIFSDISLRLGNAVESRSCDNGIVVTLNQKLQSSDWMEKENCLKIVKQHINYLINLGNSDTGFV